MHINLVFRVRIHHCRIIPGAHALRALYSYDVRLYPVGHIQPVYVSDAFAHTKLIIAADNESNLIFVHGGFLP
jgi:hypothetical protein